MSIEGINQEMLNTLSLKQKADLKERLESNLKIQKMLYDYEKSKETQDKEEREGESRCPKLRTI